MMIVVFASLLLAVSPSLVVQSDAGGATQTAASAKPKKVPKICRADEDFNSRIHTTICKTAAEWEIEDARRQNAGIAGNAPH